MNGTKGKTPREMVREMVGKVGGEMAAMMTGAVGGGVGSPEVRERAGGERGRRADHKADVPSSSSSPSALWERLEVLRMVADLAGRMARTANWIAEGEPLEGPDPSKTWPLETPTDRADVWRECVDGEAVRRVLDVVQDVALAALAGAAPLALRDFAHARESFLAVLTAARSPDPEKAMVGHRAYARNVALECGRVFGEAVEARRAEVAVEVARLEGAAAVDEAEARAARADAKAAKARRDAEGQRRALERAKRHKARAERTRDRLDRIRRADGWETLRRVLLDGDTLSRIAEESGQDVKTVRRDFREQVAVVKETVVRALPLALERMSAPAADREAVREWAVALPEAVADVFVLKRGRPSRPDAEHKRIVDGDSPRRRAAVAGDMDALDAEVYHTTRDNGGLDGDGDEDDEVVEDEEVEVARFGTVGPDVGE